MIDAGPNGYTEHITHQQNQSMTDLTARESSKRDFGRTGAGAEKREDTHVPAGAGRGTEKENLKKG